MWWLGKTEKKISALRHAVKQSFTHIKIDIKNLFSWITYLSQKVAQQQETIHEMLQQLKHQQQYMAMQHQELTRLGGKLNTLPQSEEIKQLIHHAHPHHELQKEVDLIQSQLAHIRDTLGDNQSSKRPSDALHDHLHQLENRIHELENKKPAPQPRVVKKLTKASRDYVLGVIVKYIQKYESISGSSLKEIIVDELGLCSKSSFYRHLEKIEQRTDVGFIKQGKEKQYLYKPTINN